MIFTFIILGNACALVGSYQVNHSIKLKFQDMAFTKGQDLKLLYDLAWTLEEMGFVSAEISSWTDAAYQKCFT